MYPFVHVNTIFLILKYTLSDDDQQLINASIHHMMTNSKK